MYWWNSLTYATALLLCHALQKVYPHVTEDELANMIANSDKNNDGSIDYEEVL